MTFHHLIRASRWAACALAAFASAAEAQTPAGGIPLGTGATIVQTLSAVGAERESVHSVRLASDSGLHYEWRMEEVHENGDTLRQLFKYFESSQDVSSARRLRGYHAVEQPEAHPGYTMHTFSRAILRRVIAGQPDSLQIMSVNEPAGSSMLRSFGLRGGRSAPVRWRGTIAPAERGTVAFPVLLNGRRVQLRALHLRADLTARPGRWQPEFWVLADSTYPLILKWIGAFGEPTNVLQTTRIDLPLAPTPKEGAALPPGGLLVGRGAKPDVASLERELSSACRAELPGIYFAFNSAHIAPASDRAIAELAGILSRHPDWIGTLEGHTDSIGSAAANQTLSERRVAAVRARLVERHKVSPARLKVVGIGAARPREPNATIEGRARNRRVELVRDCANGKGAS
jgi:outer membrane protein OmpA-like peptidoglycan-associated protein